MLNYIEQIKLSIWLDQQQQTVNDYTKKPNIWSDC